MNKKDIQKYGTTYSINQLVDAILKWMKKITEMWSGEPQIR